MTIIRFDKLPVKKIGKNSYAWILNSNDITGMNIGITKLAPKEKISLNTHPVTEVFFIMSGYSQLYLAEQYFQIREGDIVIVPANTKHSVKNISNETLEMIFIMPSENIVKD